MPGAPPLVAKTDRGRIHVIEHRAGDVELVLDNPAKRQALSSVNAAPDVPSLSGQLHTLLKQRPSGGRVTEGGHESEGVQGSPLRPWVPAGLADFQRFLCPPMASLVGTTVLAEAASARYRPPAQWRQPLAGGVKSASVRSVALLIAAGEQPEHRQCVHQPQRRI